MFKFSVALLKLFPYFRRTAPISVHAGRQHCRSQIRDFASKHQLLSTMVVTSDRCQKLTGKQTYDDAVRTLNSLQTNAAMLQKIRKERGRCQRNSLPEMEAFLNRLGKSVSELDALNVIHVSGTKGKGSTCAFVESILRHCGLKTGLYTSPHLVEVRERIRVGGVPLSHDKFAKYFFECYNKLVDTASDSNGAMPSYFRFLTLLAFHVFLQENIDVAILEVGVGGAYDCTNIVSSPVVCGISLLGFDHTAVLGDSLEQISWHKAGIMKPGRPAVTIPQADVALQCLYEQAALRKASLEVAPALETYGLTKSLGLSGVHQEINASLALQLCKTWMNEMKTLQSVLSASLVIPDIENICSNVCSSSKYPVAAPYVVPPDFAVGLSSASWPGRCQVVKRKSVTFYLDGAHTLQSAEACVNWFTQELSTLPESVNRRKVLLFNLSLDRNPADLYVSLQRIPWDHVVFCPNVLEQKLDSACSSDQSNFTVSRNEQIAVCVRNEDEWHKFTGQNLHSTTIFSGISDAIRWIANGHDPSIDKPRPNCPPIPDYLCESYHIDLLVVGSLHLVGGVLRFLGPEL